MKMSAMDTHLELCEKVIESQEVEIASLKSQNEKLILELDNQKELNKSLSKENDEFIEENEALCKRLNAKNYPPDSLIKFLCSHFQHRNLRNWNWTSDESNNKFDSLVECWKFGLVEFTKTHYRLSQLGADMIDIENAKNLADNYCHY
jgi:hypothetical protein